MKEAKSVIQEDDGASYTCERERNLKHTVTDAQGAWDSSNPPTKPPIHSTAFTRSVRGSERCQKYGGDDENVLAKNAVSHEAL